MPKQRFESLLANYCAPALKQYKYANMFHLPKDDDSIRSFIKQYNQQFNSKGIFFILIEQETQYTYFMRKVFCVKSFFEFLYTQFKSMWILIGF